ncbi:MAG: hypothetical protein IJ331_03425 [Ruminococcus sp.]|nr:hypothetical protein [Ruminococcus sp.]
MTLSERISYIRGLADGLELDSEKKEVKVLNAIIDLLDDMTLAVETTEDLYDELAEQVDAIDEDLTTLEDDFYDDCDCCDCDCDDCDDDCDCCDCYDDDDEAYYEVTCGKCEEQICVSEDVLLEGEITCPNCGELLEFDFSGLCDDDCDCGCCCCDDSEDLMS